MKEPKKESFFKSKGFYVALYSCIGVVMIMVGVVSYNNLTALREQPITEYTSELSSVDFDDLQTTTTNSTKSYLTPSDKDNVTEKSTTTVEPDNAAKRNLQNNATDKPADTTKPVETTKPADQTKPAEETKSTGQTNPATLQQPVTEPTPKPAETPSTTTDEPKKSKQETKKETSDATAEEPQESALEFTPYTEDEKMAWPVFGVVAMEFSDTHAIYDETLEQYRTNDDICIAASVGTQVKAAADGIVKEIKTTREGGNTIVVDNGNDWETTYSQLQDGMLVNEGDIIKKGQVIGGVAAPSIYSVLLGNHLELKVTCQDKPVNPRSIME